MMIRCPKHGIFHDDQAAGCWKCHDSTPWPTRQSWEGRSNSSTPVPVEEMGVEAMAEFSIGEAIKFGWSTATGNLGLYLVAMVICCPPAELTRYNTEPCLFPGPTHCRKGCLKRPRVE